MCWAVGRDNGDDTLLMTHKQVPGAVAAHAGSASQLPAIPCTRGAKKEGRKTICRQNAAMMSSGQRW